MAKALLACALLGMWAMSDLPLAGGAGPVPFDDAVAVWHMGDVHDSAGADSELKVEGEVKLGVVLTGADREASLARGGDGKVAELDGGWLNPGRGAGGELNLRGSAMSLCIRLRDPSGEWNRGILSRYGGGHDSLSYNLFSAELSGSGRAPDVGFELGTAAGRGMVQVRSSVDQLVEPAGWHDLVVRYDGRSLELFFDGVWVDQRPASGELRRNDVECIVGGYSVDGQVPKPFHGQIDHAALWQRALNDGEIIRLSGGRELVEKRKAVMARVAGPDFAMPQAPYTPEALAAYAAGQLAIRRDLLARDPHRPIYHFQAPRGWMNDPNGPICYKGEYHLFYQFGPRKTASAGVPIHWGHAVSKDLVHWTDLPIALYPAAPFDEGGAWSGNVVIDDHGTPSAIYTGRHGDRQPGILATSSDGMLSWKKQVVMDRLPYESNPPTQIHHDGFTWREGDTWFQLVGGRFNNAGAAVLWSSPDLVHWTYRNRIYSTPRYGGFWELPYLVPLGGRHVLIIGVAPVRYWVGTYDNQKFTFTPDREEAEILDYSTTYYSPNLNMVDDKGPGGTRRRLMHGWVLHGSPTKGVPYWEGMHSVPRVLTLEGNHLIQQPIPEIQMLRGRHWRLEGASIDKPAPGLLKEVRGDALEIIAEFEGAGCTARQFGVKLRMAADGKQETLAWYDVPSGDMGTGGLVHGGGHRGPAGLKADQPVRMHILLDKSVLELFVNGRAVTERLFPDPASLGLDVFAQGGTVRLKSIDVWEMKSAWDSPVQNGSAVPATQPASIGDKTLVAWVSPANLTQQGSGVACLINGETFDAIVLGEKQRGKWMAGSDYFKRTQENQSASPLETAQPGQFVQIAIAYSGTWITIYHNGQRYSDYDAGSRAEFDSETDVLIGARYRGELGETGFFEGDIDEVRLYGQALDEKTLQGLRPGEVGQTRPLGMWTFDEAEVVDRMGNYPRGRLMGEATIADGKLRLNGHSAYALVAAPRASVAQAGFFTPVRKGQMWDNWLCYESGKYYLYYLAGAGGRWDGHELATSEDGVHWTEHGVIVKPRPGVQWMGTGHIWKSPDFEKSHRWVMNYSEWLGDKQDIMFVTSTDLVNWTKVDEKHRFVQDTRWYKEKGRWDCIDCVQCTDGSLYGYFTADPDPARVSYRPCGFGFAQSKDGITWTALPPVEGDIGGELGGIQKIGERYYVLVSEGRVARGDRPQGPFYAQKKNPNAFGTGCDIYFPRFFHNAPGGPLVDHFYNNGTVYAAPLKAIDVDREGILRLKWWTGNEAIKATPLEAQLAAPAADGAAKLHMLSARLDRLHTYVIEGTLEPPAAAIRDYGIYFDSGGAGQCLLLNNDGARFGQIKADGSDLKVLSTFGRDMEFSVPLKFRLVIKGDMMESYLNDYLLCAKRVRYDGQIGFMGEDAGGAFKDIRLWQSK